MPINSIQALSFQSDFTKSKAKITEKTGTFKENTTGESFASPDTALKNKFIAGQKIAFGRIALPDAQDAELIDYGMKRFKSPVNAIDTFRHIVCCRYNNPKEKALKEKLHNDPDFAEKLMNACLDKIEEIAESKKGYYKVAKKEINDIEALANPHKGREKEIKTELDRFRHVFTKNPDVDNSGIDISGKDIFMDSIRTSTIGGYPFALLGTAFIAGKQNDNAAAKILEDNVTKWENANKNN